MHETANPNATLVLPQNGSGFVYKLNYQNVCAPGFWFLPLFPQTRLSCCRGPSFANNSDNHLNSEQPQRCSCTSDKAILLSFVIFFFIQQTIYLKPEEFGIFPNFLYHLAWCWKNLIFLHFLVINKRQQIFLLSIENLLFIYTTLIPLTSFFYLFIKKTTQNWINKENPRKILTILKVHTNTFIW